MGMGGGGNKKESIKNIYNDCNALGSLIHAGAIIGYAGKALLVILKLQTGGKTKVSGTFLLLFIHKLKVSGTFSPSHL